MEREENARKTKSNCNLVLVMSYQHFHSLAACACAFKCSRLTQKRMLLKCDNIICFSLGLFLLLDCLPFRDPFGLVFLFSVRLYFVSTGFFFHGILSCMLSVSDCNYFLTLNFILSLVAIRTFSVSLPSKWDIFHSHRGRS